MAIIEILQENLPIERSHGAVTEVIFEPEPDMLPLVNIDCSSRRNNYYSRTNDY